MNKVVLSYYVGEFTRHMDHSNGRAFELVWGNPMTLDKDHTSEQNQRILDALTWQPSTLHPALHKQLKRKLVMLAAEFNDDVFLLLQCILDAATGDYSLLAEFVKNFNIMPSSEAHEYFFDTINNDAPEVDNA